MCVPCCSLKDFAEGLKRLAIWQLCFFFKFESKILQLDFFKFESKILQLDFFKFESKILHLKFFLQFQLKNTTVGIGVVLQFELKILQLDFFTVYWHCKLLKGLAVNKKLCRPTPLIASPLICLLRPQREQVGTRRRPPTGRRCIPDVVLKNEGSMVQTCRNINVHVVNTDTCWDPHECLWVAKESRQSKCAQYKLKFVNKTWQQKHWGKHVFFFFFFFFFFFENQIFGFPWCSTREDLPIDVLITNVGLILTKLWWFLFSGYGQTDRHGFVILTWKHVGTQKISTQNSISARPMGEMATLLLEKIWWTYTAKCIRNEILWQVFCGRKFVNNRQGVKSYEKRFKNERNFNIDTWRGGVDKRVPT